MDLKKNIAIIIQARLSSKRLPKKVLKKIYKNFTSLDILIKRLKRSKNCKNIIFAIPKKDKNSSLEKKISEYNLDIFYGSEKNVLARYYFAAKKYKLKNIIRITSDCPIIDYNLLDKMIQKFFLGNYDYLSNTIFPTYPDGTDVEIFKFSTLEKSYKETKNSYDCEHVTPYIKRSIKFKKFNYKNEKNLSDLRVTLDTKKDLYNIRKIIDYFKDIFFNLKKIENLPPNILHKIKSPRVNNFISREEKSWIEAKEFIPDGNNFLSKRPELFSTNKWPIYYSKAKGCIIWDQNKNKYIDLSLMGVGTNILGYSNTNINKAVINKINKSSVSTLNSIEEIQLAKKLIKIHPWSGKVKFARTGGEANLIALRIARAYNNKDKVIFCGYHGWHDWYLSNNLKKKSNLNEHLFKNLKIDGVIKNFKNLTYSFRYNDLNAFKKILKESKNISALIMEVRRNIKPKANFLEKIKVLCRKNKIVLIFDECTSGFRCNFGGLHLKYNVNPDIAVFGKALGNGYAINAILGNNEVMNSSKKTFMSSTFWSEGVGFAAGLSTLKEMEKVKPWIHLKRQGKKIKKFWKKMSAKYNQKIEIGGLDEMPSFKFENDHQLKKIFMIEFFLKNKILISDTIYLCISHTDKILSIYFKLFEKFIIQIKNIDIHDLKIKYQNYKSVQKFSRLN